MTISSDQFVFYNRETLQRFYGTRENEVRIGEKLLTIPEDKGLDGLKDLKEKGVKYVIFGVPESIGPLANLGQSGAQNGWDAFLSVFPGMQDNRHLDGSKIACIGHVNLRRLQAETGRMHKSHSDTLPRLREICSQIDELVLPVVNAVFEHEMVPILIGGGHNNAYPLLKGAANVLAPGKGINCINCDPHADYKPLEGRHSGNGFSYAREEGFLKRYAITGLHRNYNSENMLERMHADPDIYFDFLEDTEDRNSAIKEAIDFVSQEKHPVGVELDMDSIAFMPVSAFTPAGISVDQARHYIRAATRALDPVYLHLPEAAPAEMQRDTKIAGKALAFLVADFIHSKENQ